MTVTCYSDAITFLVTKGKPVPRKKIANNTYVEKGGHTTGRGDQIHEGEIGIVLHETAVVVYGPGYIRLNTGGWLTMTTRDRIDHFTPERVRLFSDDNGRWRLAYTADARGASGLRYTWADEQSVAFHDGLALCYDVESDHWLPTFADEHYDTRAEDAHNAMVKRLVKGYLKAVRTDDVRLVWDACALCRYTDVPEMTGTYCTRAIIPNVGDKIDDQQHLIDHMIEGVLPRELEHHALREVAGSDERAQMWLMSDHHRTEALRKFLLTRLLKGAVAIKHGRRPVTV